MVTYHLYNLTGMQVTGNSTANNMMLDLVRDTSSQTGYLPGVFILVSVFLVLFLALKAKGHTAKGAFAATSWAITVLSIIMYPLQIINWQLFITGIMLTPIAVLMLFLTGED